MIPRTPDNCLVCKLCQYLLLRHLKYSERVISGKLCRVHGCWCPGAWRTQFVISKDIHDDVINGNLFRVTGPLWGESIGHRWLPLTKASFVELMFSLIWTNSWAKNRDASDLKHHRAHYDITMTWLCDMGMYNFLQSVSNSLFYKYMGNVLIYGHNDDNKILTYTYICNICIWLASINFVTGAVLISMVNFSMNTEAQQKCQRWMLN